VGTTALAIAIAVFGGLGTIWGPVVGALLLYGLNEALRFVGVVYNLIVVGLNPDSLRHLRAARSRRPPGATVRRHEGNRRYTDERTSARAEAVEWYRVRFPSGIRARVSALRERSIARDFGNLNDGCHAAVRREIRGFVFQAGRIPIWRHAATCSCFKAWFVC